MDTHAFRQKEKRQRKLSYFLRRERCSKLGRCEHRPSCTRLRLRRTLTAIAVANYYFVFAKIFL